MWIRVTMMVMMMMMMMMMIRLQKTGAYSSLLSIGRADPRLNGNYTCTASNAAATAEFTADLHVHGKYLSLPLNRMTMKWIEKKNRFLLLIYIVNYNGIFRKKIIARIIGFVVDWSLFTARRVCIARTMLSEDVCPSVCHMPVFCRHRWTYPTFFIIR